MREPAAVPKRGWLLRMAARSGATSLALIGHLAVLFAMTYVSDSKVIVGEPPAIVVELVSEPGRQRAATPPSRPTPVDDQPSPIAWPDPPAASAADAPAQIAWP